MSLQRTVAAEGQWAPFGSERSKAFLSDYQGRDLTVEAADSGLAQKIGRSIGQILTEQHTQIVETDAAGWLPQQVPWPEAGP